MSDEESPFKIVMAGVGGAGCNTVQRLARTNSRGPKLLALNTDKKQLNTLPDPIHKVLLGASFTKGLGAGGDPSVGLKAALASKKLIEQEVHDADLVFLTAGMGGGTGTGAAPVVAEIARDHGALVISVVTFPFALERARIKKAQAGVAKLTESSNSTVVIQNDKLVEWVPNERIERAFELADEVMAKAVGGVSRTIMEPSLVNLDFMDVKSVTQDGGLAMISLGEGSGYMRVEDAANATLQHPLLDVDWSEATGALLHITGGPDLTLGDATEAGDRITAKLPDSTNVVWGARMDADYEKRVEAFVIFTGIPSPLLLDPEATEGKG